MSNNNNNISTTLPNDEETESDVFNMSHESSNVPSTAAHIPFVGNTQDLNEIEDSTEDDSIFSNKYNDHTSTATPSDSGTLVLENNDTVRTFYCFSHDEEEGHIDVILEEAVNISNNNNNDNICESSISSNVNESIDSATEQEQTIIPKDNIENSSRSLQNDDRQLNDTSKRNQNKLSIRSNSHSSVKLDRNNEGRSNQNKALLVDGTTVSISGNDSMMGHQRRNSYSSSNHSNESYNESHIQQQQIIRQQQGETKTSRPPLQPSTQSKQNSSYKDIRKLSIPNGPIRRQQSQQHIYDPDRYVHTSNRDISPMTNRRILDDEYNNNSRSNSNGRSDSRNRPTIPSHDRSVNNARSNSNRRVIVDGNNNKSGHSTRSSGRNGSNGRSNSNGRTNSNGRAGSNGRTNSNGRIVVESQSNRIISRHTSSNENSGSNGRTICNGRAGSNGRSGSNGRNNSNGRSGSNGRNTSNGRSGSNGRNNSFENGEGHNRNNSNERAGSNGRNNQQIYTTTKTTRIKLDNVGRCNSAPQIVYDCTSNNRREQVQTIKKSQFLSNHQPRSSNPRIDQDNVFVQHAKEPITQYHHARSHSAAIDVENNINHINYPLNEKLNDQQHSYRSSSPNNMTKDIQVHVNTTINPTYSKIQPSTSNENWNSKQQDHQSGLQEQKVVNAYPKNYRSDIVLPANEQTTNYDSSSDDDDDSCGSEMCHSDDDDSRSLALSVYIEKKYKREDNELDQKYIPPLVMRAYHLPGYTWTEDWMQNMTNNHPVLGLCCHHPRHPIQGWTRVATLFGSVLFGLAITNAVYLAFVFTNIDYNKTYFQISNSAVGAGGVTINSLLSVTNGNIALWTFGVTLHALYDNTIWSLAACACFMDHQKMKVTEKMKRYQRTGSYLVMLSVLFVLALTTFVVVVRGSLDEDGDGRIGVDEEKTLNGIFSTTDDNNNTSTSADPTSSNWTLYDDDIFNNTLAFVNNNKTTTISNTTAIATSFKQATKGHRYAFLVSYCIELVLSYTIFYPIVGTILFSGILTCGRYPVFGGRPYEIRQEQIEEERKRVRIERQQKRIERDERRKQRIRLQQEAIKADSERFRWKHDIEIATIDAVATKSITTNDTNVNHNYNDDTNTISVIEISIPITSNQYGGYSCNNIT